MWKWPIYTPGLPAARMFPPIQNVARIEIIDPRLVFAWNSVKYVKMTGMLPPTLNHKDKQKSKCLLGLVFAIKYVLSL